MATFNFCRAFARLSLVIPCDFYVCCRCCCNTALLVTRLNAEKENAFRWSSPSSCGADNCWVSRRWCVCTYKLVFVLVICGLASCFSVPQLGDAFKETIRFGVIKITMRLKKMALRLHIDKKYWRCVYNILRCVYKEITMRLWEKIWRCVYITGRKKMQLAPPDNSHCSWRTLQA